jgi:hypothetical protein
MNNSLLSETKENDGMADILARIFAYIAIPSATLIIAVALWTIFVKN